VTVRRRALATASTVIYKPLSLSALPGSINNSRRAIGRDTRELSYYPMSVQENDSGSK